MMRRMSLIAMALLISGAFAAGAAGAEIGQIKTLQGDVTIVRDGTSRPASPGDLLHRADVVQTGDDGGVGITFIDNSRFSAGPNTRIALKRFRFNPTTHDGDFTAEMKRGTVTVVSGQIAKKTPDAMKIVTPTTILGFRGTTVAVEVSE